MKHIVMKIEVTLISSIITNGTLLNEVIIKSLIKYNCEYIQITLDGVEIFMIKGESENMVNLHLIKL